MKRKEISILRVVFMGTPDIAATVLKAIIEKGHDVVAVVTQPDKPKGRGREIQFPPVKELALSHNISVFQPQKIKNNPEIEEVNTGYGKIRLCKCTRFTSAKVQGSSTYSMGHY